MTDTLTRLRNLAKFAYEALICCWSLGFIFLVVRQMMANHFFFTVGADGFGDIDFVKFFTCGEIVRSNERCNLYSSAVQTRFLEQLYSSFTGQHPVWNPKFTFLCEYTPPFCIFMSLLSLLSLTGAYLFWIFLSIFLGCLGLLAVLDMNRSLSKEFKLIFLASTLISFQSWSVIRGGQVGWLAAALIALLYLSFTRKNNFLCGLSLALLFLKPQLSIYFIVPLVACRRWSSLLYTAIFTSLIWGFSAIVLSPKTVIEYPNVIIAVEHIANATQMSVNYFVSLRGPLTYFMDFTTAYYISFAVAAVALFAVFFLWLRVSSKDQTVQAMAFAITVMVCLVTNPHQYSHDGVLLALPAAILFSLPANSLKNNKSLLLCRILLYAYPLISCVVFITHDLTQLPAIHVFTIFIVNVILTAGCLFIMRQLLIKDVEEPLSQ